MRIVEQLAAKLIMGRFLPWSINHSVSELSGFFKDLRGTCLIRRLIALSLPGPDTFEAEIICTRWCNIERSSLDGSVFRQHSQYLSNAQNMKRLTACTEVKSNIISIREGTESKLTRHNGFIFPSDFSCHTLC